MKTHIYLLLLILTSLSLCRCSQKEELKPFYPGRMWLDNSGQPINAHAGGILFHKGVYYWYGQHMCDTTSSAMVGITCYSSRNLTDWKNEGCVLPVEEKDESSDIIKGCVMERPKVIYNKGTKKFVMWFHLELKGKGYKAARAASAVSDSPTGPFKYRGSLRPNAGKYPYEMTAEQRAGMDTLDVTHYKGWWTPEWYTAVRKGLILKRDFEGGQMARDMQLFVDDDGKAYHIFSSEENLTLHIAELSDDYLYHTGKYTRVAPGGMNEAPALFKHKGTYWMITSGCTGWAPNKARMFSAQNIMGPWKQHDTPCVGPDSEITFKGQSTFILPVHGRKNAFIFMADIWKPEQPSDARYIWLPIRFDNDMPVVEWMDNWKLDFYSHPEQ